MSKAKTDIKLTAIRAREVLNYEPATGSLTWRDPQSSRVQAGDDAGTIASTGRRYVTIDGVQYLAHRVAWLHQTGELPEQNVAPKNGDYLDLRFDNFVLETPAETSRKRSRGLGASGVKGVSWDKSKNKWYASITRDYKQISLGRYATKEEAAAAYARAVADGVAENSAPSAEERKVKAASVALRIKQRHLWKKALKDAGGIVGWLSLESFIEDIGSDLPEKSVLCAADDLRPIGPGNFMWRKIERQWKREDRESRIEYNRNHRKIHPMRYRDMELKRNFGLSLEDYQRMHDAQDGKCAICKESERALNKRGETAWLAVDHNHKTGAIRALLCGHCNKMIGNARETAKWLRDGAEYLEKYERESTGADDASLTCEN